MKLAFEPFNTFIQENTTYSSRSRYQDSEVVELSILEEEIKAIISGTSLYIVEIKFDMSQVHKVSCTCRYNHGGYCKHIINVMINADDYLKDRIYENVLPSSCNSKTQKPPIKEKKTIPKVTLEIVKEGNIFRLIGQNILTINNTILTNISIPAKKRNSDFELNAVTMASNLFDAKISNGFYYNSESWKVKIKQLENELQLSCSCGNTSKKICPHIRFTVLEIIYKKWLQLPFNEEQRRRSFQEEADRKGLGNLSSKELDNLFSMVFSYGRIQIQPKFRILSLTEESKEKLKRDLLHEFQFPVAQSTEYQDLIVLEEFEYRPGLKFTLMKAPLTKLGKIKSPIDEVNLSNFSRNTKDHDELLFYSALLSQHHHSLTIPQQLDILKNPFNFPYYFYDKSQGYKKISPKSIRPVTISTHSINATILVKEAGSFYVLSCTIFVNGKKFTSKKITLKNSFFFSSDTDLHFIDNETIRNVLDFFKKEKHEIYIHQSRFSAFKEEFLDKLENSITVKYDFVKKAPAKIVKEKSLNKITTHLIYLAEREDYILITPVVTYGEKEVPILSKRTIYTESADGTLYEVKRDEKTEFRFLRVLQIQHPTFSETPNTDFFYLHKQEFLDEGWFVDAFEEWRENNYTVLGFKDIKNNNYNTNKMKVSTAVSSGINWFDVHLNISFGEQKAGLKDIQKSIVNKNRFVKLGDGTQGLLPQEWIDKFGHYFRSGEIKNDVVRTHKSNFQLIDQLFEKEVLSEDIRIELENYKEKVKNFSSIQNIKVPKKLKATLRNYQKEGLNWLSFLDEFGFGGCLADDMGLGKTIQVIAYFLVQHEKGNKDTNLVIVPTSLLFNWQKEMDKFAPHLKYLVLYGSNRETKNVKFEKYDVLLTTYGTLLSDIKELKEQHFNIIVLDESQAIKNPNSKRYKVVRLLQGRQRLVVTGTPVENNTFDLYSQLSFAMPGLLGSAKRFKDDYSTPIDKFQDEKRAKELQQKVHPFILRRTKNQVAKELPEKTEMVVYCEMGTQQRKVYDTYKTEFQKYLQNTSDEELQSSALHVLQGLTKLRQICNSPALLSDQEFYGEESSKLDELSAQIKMLKDQHKILVFSQFVGMLDLIKERLDNEKIKYAYLTGKTRNREEQVDIFQNDDEIRVFLISLKAGGTGLNLTSAEYVFIVDPWWNPAVENQAIDRAHRIGQKNKVIAVRLIVPNSIEEKILELQERKLQLVENLIHTDSNALKKLTKEDLIKLL